MSFYSKLTFSQKIVYNIIKPFVKFGKFFSDHPSVLGSLSLLIVQANAVKIQLRQESSTTGVTSKDYNPDKWFIECPHIDPKLVQSITKFRSVFGHPYYGGDQSKLKCQSEKHYFDFFPKTTTKDLVVKSPCHGTITTIRHEDMGDQIEIKPNPTKYPYYKDRNIVAIIFHIRPDEPFYIGQNLTAGERLGTHYTMNTCSDVAIRNYDEPNTTLSSAFEYMPPEIYSQYGIYPEQMIISQEVRDQFPSHCNNTHDPMPPAEPGGPADWEIIHNNFPK
ncbi:MAG: hypothetical protein PVI75_04965 [Gammaproteobacteria bacterium]|jgi:hypothetical protein